MPPVDPNQTPNSTPSPISAPVSSVPPLTASTPEAGRSGSKWLVATVCALVFFVAAGSAGAYYVFFALPSSPKAILQKALLASMGPQSFSFMATSTGKANTSPVGGSALAVNFTFAMQGSLDNRVTNSPAFDGTFGGTVSASNATSTGQARILFHSIYTNKKVYLTLKDFNASYNSTDPREAGTQFFVIIANGVASSLENKWIETDASSSASGISLPLLASSSPALARDKAALNDYLHEMSYLESVQNTGTETVGGSQDYHLAVTMRYEQQLADILLNLNTDQEGSLLKPGSEEYNKLKESLSAQVGKEAHLDVWVGKDDYHIYKMTLAPLNIIDKTSNSDVTVDFEITYADYGKNFSIVAPAGAEPLEQVMQSLFGGFMTPASSKAKK